MRLKRSLGSLRIAVTVAFTVAIGLFVFLFFPAQPAEAASMTFTSNTTITSDQTIAAGETWTVNLGVKLVIAKGVTITNDGIIDTNNHGIGGSFINNGTINNNLGGTINSNFGVFTNDGTIILYVDINNGIINNDGTITGGFHNNLGGTMTNDGAINAGFTNNLGGTITNDGTISGFGPIINFGTLINSGTIKDADSFISNRGTLDNSGNIILNGGCGPSECEVGNIYNDGIITNSGNINNESIIVNSGTINNTAIINNSWLIQNFGTITNTKIINNSILIQNLGNFTNSGTIDNTGTINNKCVATFNDTGTLTGNPVSHEACIYNSLILEQAVDFNTSDLVINLGQEVRAIAMTNDNSVKRITFSWINPTNDTVHTETLPVSFTFLNHDASFADTFNIEAFFLSFTPDEVGQWTLQMDFNNGVVLRETLNVPI